MIRLLCLDGVRFPDNKEMKFSRLEPMGARAAVWLALSAGRDAARWAALRGALWNWRAGRGDARP